MTQSMLLGRMTCVRICTFMVYIYIYMYVYIMFFAPGVFLAKDRHIVGEPMRASEAGQELLCLDAWGPVLRACLLARCDRAIPTSRPGARPWDRVALHAVQPVLNIYIYI